MPTPIALSEQQMMAVWAAARSLPPNARGAFLEEVAREISRHPVLGDGLLHRVIMQVQKKHFDPPQFRNDNGGKYDRLRRRARTG
jgi:hypothetical protein